jgi:membrane-bound serine protease (ClpP class)
MGLTSMHRIQTVLTLCFFLWVFGTSVDGYAQTEQKILKIVLEGDINPIASEYIEKHIDRAVEGRYECLLIQMDTPGGLLESTKSIVKAIIASPVPVVMYVAPSGSGAVSAGVFITMACHIAVMAEGTNIGAAHPVGIGGQGQTDSTQVMGEKVTNWASAWIRGIAEKRGRNADWAEQAVRRSVSINEDEALRINVIDYVCTTEEELLAAIHGDTVNIGEDQLKVLYTMDATVDVSLMNWRDKILYKLSNPTIAYILLMLGIYGLFFELQNPGAMIPGIVGAIFLILAFFALQTLPVRTAGLMLLGLALVLFILEIKVTSFGILTIGGVVAMFLGALMLFDQTPGFSVGVDWKVALTIAVATGLFFVFALGMAVKARLTQPTTGSEGLIGAPGVAISSINPRHEGDIKIKGEIWRATSPDTVKKGDRVKVVHVDGLVLTVKKDPLTTA